MLFEFYAVAKLFKKHSHYLNKLYEYVECDICKNKSCRIYHYVKFTEMIDNPFIWICYNCSLNMNVNKLHMGDIHDFTID